MNREQIIQMAREAGLLTIGTADGSEAVYTWPKGITEELERFAALVAAAEREANACVLDEMADQMVADMEPSTAVAWVRSKAAEIRARGKTV